jgi:hypothetical protein
MGRKGKNVKGASTPVDRKLEVTMHRTMKR